MSSIQKKIWFGLGMAGLILALFIGLVVLPLFNKIKTNAQEYLANQEELAKLGKKEPLFRELEKDYQAKQNDLNMVKGVFLARAEAVGFIATLETIAQQTGNSFEIKSAILSENKTPAWPYITFQISLQGSFSNLLNFLASLEDSPYPPYRLTEMENLSIRRIELADQSGLLATDLLVKIYTQ